MRLVCQQWHAIIPPFNADGLLPPGDYEVSFDEMRHSLLAIGPEVERSSSWDTQWRLVLIANLEIPAQQLWQVGVREIFADGSFAEDKDHPNDIDGYFVCSLDELKSGELARQLNLLDPYKMTAELLDPYKIWIWDTASRKPYRGSPKKQLPMWHRYRVELYPHISDLRLGSGIRDKFGHELEFPAAFRQSRRDGKPRGIVRIKYGDRS